MGFKSPFFAPLLVWNRPNYSFPEFPHSRALMLFLLICHVSHLSVCVSVSMQSVLWQNGWIDPDAIWDGEWGWLTDGCIRSGWWLSKGKGQFWGDFGASHCNQSPWGLCCVVVRERHTLPKLLWEDLLQFICYLITLEFNMDAASFSTTVGQLSTCNRKLLELWSLGLQPLPKNSAGAGVGQCMKMEWPESDAWL